MKKAYLFLASLLIVFACDAQMNLIPTEKMPGGNKVSISEANKLSNFGNYIKARKKGAARTTAYAASEWYDMNAQYSYPIPTTGYYYAMYPDSNVIDATGTSPYHMYTHGMGFAFDPQDSAYSYGTHCIYPILPHMPAGTSYAIDSFNIPITYKRNNPTTTVVDSVILEFVVTHGPINDTLGADSGAYNYQVPTANPAYMDFCWDRQPRFATLHYNSGCGMLPAPYNAEPYINDCYFDSIFAPKVRIAIPLTNATAYDTDANGFLNLNHILSGTGGTVLPIVPALAVSPNEHFIYYLSFKSGVNYPLGTLSTSANFLKVYCNAFDLLLDHPQSVGSFQGGLMANNTVRYNDLGFLLYRPGHDALIPFFCFTGFMNYQFPFAGFHVRDTTVPPVALKFFCDTNSNCVKDAGEPYLWQPATVEIDSAGIAIDTVSVTSGFYYYEYGPIGTIYTYKVLSIPSGLYVLCPSTGIYYDTVNAITLTPTTKYFALACVTTAAHDLRIFAISCAGTHTMRTALYADNTYCTPTAATVTIYSDMYGYSSSSLLPLTLYTGATTWNAGNLSILSPTPFLLTANFAHPLPYYIAGDTTQPSFTITPITGDGNPSDNVQTDIDTITTSYDPNAIVVKPTCIEHDDTGTLLKYTITFENTGNDTAHHVYVMDTLPDNVNLTSMRLLMSSHEMYMWHLKDGAGHNVVKFDFPNINLLDSTHMGLCDGAIIFTIRTKTGLTSGTNIYNRASIYFDDNAPVVTNKVNTHIGGCLAAVPVVQQPAGIALFPNPAGKEITITSGEKITSVVVSDLLGQSMLASEYNAQRVTVNIETLPAGIYFVKINGVAVRKFVKQ